MADRKQIESTHCISFSEDEARVTILKSGFEELWIVVYDDPIFPLNAVYMSKQEIRENFKIEV